MPESDVSTWSALVGAAIGRPPSNYGLRANQNPAKTGLFAPKFNPDVPVVLNDEVHRLDVFLIELLLLGACHSDAGAAVDLVQHDVDIEVDLRGDVFPKDGKWKE